MVYVLENKKESDRLEEQSKLIAYDYHEELRDLILKPHSKVLDAGCGSGVVARYLAEQYPDCNVIGCDTAEERLNDARQFAGSVSNLEFVPADLRRLGFAPNKFDLILCRYVIEHLSGKDRAEAFRELHRVIKPGGTLVAIDFDGGFHNLFPKPKFIGEVLAKIQQSQAVDLFVGRKLSWLMHAAGFESLSYRVQAVSFAGEALGPEKKMLAKRFSAARPFLTKLLGSELQVLRFEKEYLEALDAPGAVLFYNKFIVSGRKGQTTAER